MATNKKRVNKEVPSQILQQSLHPGQRSAPGGNLLNYLYRIIPAWMNPQWTDAVLWRNFVLSIPVATLCRDTLINGLLDLSWKVAARDPNQQDELKDDIVYYTDLFNQSGYDRDVDWSNRIEWLGKDLLDLPFGCAEEIGRENDKPTGRVAWTRLLDAGTLMPTLNFDFPVIQRVPNIPLEPVAFPKYAIVRAFMSPRTEIWREGFGMAPPERIYLAMELLRRGDKYFAELLLNTPEVGILDLGDMEKDVAEEWVEGMRALMVGVDAMKIPVLYEHTSKIEWIDMSIKPSEMMFDDVTMRYIKMVCAGYGMTASDIGLGGSSNGGNTLAGAMRDERKTKGNGQAIVKRKFKELHDKILPKPLEFLWIDYNEEENVTLSRAQLAFAQAAQLLIQNQVFTNQELRQQALQNGLVTVSVPEKMPKVNIPVVPGNPTGSQTVGGAKNPVSPAQGGHGDITAQETVMRSDLNIPNFEPMLGKIYQPVANLIASTNDLIDGDSEEWKKVLSDPLWWENPDESMQMTVNKIRRTTTNLLTNKGLSSIGFDKNDIPLVQEAMKQKGADTLAQYIEEHGSELTQQDLDHLNDVIDGVNVEDYFNYVALEAQNILKALFTSTSASLLAKSMTKFGIDDGTGKNDNKIKAIREANRKLRDAYPELLKAAEDAGQNMLDEVISSDLDHYITGIRPLEPQQEYATKS